MQSKWAEDSPNHLVLLHEMFCHAASEGWKEAEWIIHQGHQQHMPQLNPDVGIPTIELVGPETSREELIEIYQEVYRLHRLPGSPPGELAIAEEVLAAIPDCLQRREEAPEDWAQPSPGDSTHPTVEGPTGNKKARWIEVLPEYTKHTKMHSLLRWPWMEKSKG